MLNGQQLQAEPIVGSGLGVARLQQSESVNVRFRQGGERCQPVGRSGSQSLKKLFQEVGLEPWWRDRVPLLYSGDELIAVADLWICQGWQALPGQPGINIRWDK
ncbi:tRNA lysidine(34) synthetase TilS [Oceanicoccus sp. KOV_DT_Chl]|uniref:tRNA lysidine(34) synthetase TilS n=1 Tax=Oceanicoccus sp. KOV_DT_Chl TaxID=1904639 RepID=UPI001F2FFD4E|nr:tRNA lysidine(34) synthetase TilS [Oceanicoccus sp. KOV_DT_Chl]